jgi:putative oxidoreductase
MATIARCLIAFFFVASGSGKIFAFRQSSTILAAIGFPMPKFFLTAIIAVEIAGGLGLLFNLWTSSVAVTLIVFLIFATVAIHARFVRDPVAGTDQIVHMIKNIAIIGGLINFVAS